MASIDHLHQEFLKLKVKDYSDILSVQYPVNYLEEVLVCHGITTQEPRQRPMKETLHSRHHSTVLPRLGSSRICHQNLHTHAVDSAIQLQGNNRVLKKRPPSISDKEQRLNRRQRYTLSQLRSGHCHILQDYKHMVLGESSDICTDCGASPHDVRHLFACTTHPTDLSPEDLWRKPVGSIRAFSYLDNGTLTDLTTDLVVANNNNNQSTATAIMTCTPESERVALEKRRKIVLAAFHTSMQSLNKMTFKEAALRRNGNTIYSLSEKDPEPGDYGIVAFARKHIVMH